MKRKDRLDAIATICGVALFLAVGIGLARYKYTDCKKVGHSTFYCILDLSR